MKKTIAGFALIVTVAFMSCQPESSVRVLFSLTDAPVNPAEVTAVNVVVSAVSVNENRGTDDAESSWTRIDIDPAVSVNLLDLQNGVTAALGGVTLAGGTQINQIRLTVDSVTVTEADNTVHGAVIPSATGFKIVNAFQVPQSGDVTIAIDFDVRKALVARADGYLVKPAIRAVISNEAGQIEGSVGTTGAVAVYAYLEGSYAETEKIPDSDGATFLDAYSSSLVKADGTYVMAFMDAGVYDILAVDVSGSDVGMIEGVAVAEGATTHLIDF